MPEFACITFKMKQFVKEPEPCFSVFRGTHEVCSLPIESVTGLQLKGDQINRQRIYQLSVSSSFLKGNILSKDFNSHMVYFFQNYLVSVWYQRELRFEFQEFQVQWIKKISNSNEVTFDIKIKLIGIKDLILTHKPDERIVRYGLFPLLKDKFVVGNQLLMQYVDIDDDHDDIQIDYKFFGIQLKSVIYMSQYNYEQKLTLSRYLMSDRQIIVETYMRDLFNLMQEDIFRPSETLFILKQVNRRILNSIPLKFDFFIDNMGFSHDNVLKNNQNNNYFILKNEERQFLPAEVLNGMTILEILYDRENMSNEINQNLVKLFQDTLRCTKMDFVQGIQKLIRTKQSKRFGFTILETILGKYDIDRIEKMVDQGILLLPKESLQLNVNLKPLVEDLLQNNNILVADYMIQSIQLSPIDQGRKYNFLMFLIPFIQQLQITGEELPSFFNFFLNYETKEEQDASQIVKFESHLPFSIVKKFYKNDIHMNSRQRNYDLAFDQHDDYLISQVHLNQIKREKKQSFKSHKCISKVYELFYEQQYSQIEYNYIDFQAYNLSKKILNLSTVTEISQFKKIQENGIGMSMFELAELCEDISDLNQDQLQQMDIIRNLIDHQFQLTQFIQLTNFVIFLVLYIIPFAIQLTIEQNQSNKSEWQFNLVRLCNIVCMITATYFELVELTQLFNNQKSYFKSFNNIAEQGMFILNCIYFVFRVNNSQQYIPKVKHLDPTSYRYDLENQHTKTVSMQAVVLNTAMMIFIFLKINTWMRLYDKFSNLYTNVKESVKDMMLFLFYFAYWVIFLSMLFYGMGGSFYEGEDAEQSYQGLQPIIAQLIQVFRNSLGDIGVPQYPYWIKRDQKGETEIASVFIFFIWGFFIVNEILMLIVLLNFLIAIVSESYTRVNNIQVRFNYRLKAELNQETYLLVKFFFIFAPCFKKFKYFNLYIIEQEMKQYPESDSQMTNKIAEVVGSQIRPLKDKIESLEKTILQVAHVLNSFDSSTHPNNSDCSEQNISADVTEINPDRIHTSYQPTQDSKYRPNPKMNPKLMKVVQRINDQNNAKNQMKQIKNQIYQIENTGIMTSNDKDIKLVTNSIDQNYFNGDAMNNEEPAITIGPANLLMINKQNKQP